MDLRMLRVLSIGIVLAGTPALAIPPLPVPVRMLAYYYAGHIVNRYSKEGAKVVSNSMLSLDKLGDGSIAKITALDLKLVGHSILKELFTNRIQLLHALALVPAAGQAFDALGNVVDNAGNIIIAANPHFDPLLDKAYSAGLRYLTIWEFYYKLVGLADEWEKLHAKPLEFSNTTIPVISDKSITLHTKGSQTINDKKYSIATDVHLSTTPVSKKTYIPWQSLKDDEPVVALRDFIRWLGSGHVYEDTSNTTIKWGSSLFYEHANHTFVALLHFIISYALVEGITRKFGDATRIVLVNNGAPMLNNPLYARTIKVAAGMAASHAVQKPVMGAIKDILYEVNLYDPEADDLNNAAYLAAYKGPFLWESIKAHKDFFAQAILYVSPIVVALRGHVPPKVLAAAGAVATLAVGITIASLVTNFQLTAPAPAAKEEL